MNSNSNYETLYGVGLLDDLHNYFPALLYDSGQFHSVPSVLGYIQTQTRNRFDLFSYGSREYLARHTPPQRRVQRNMSEGIDLTVIDESHTRTTTSSSQPRVVQAILRQNTYTIPSADEDDEEADDESSATSTHQALTRALMSLLQLPARQNMDQFLQPVTVRPTDEEIAMNSTIGMLVSDTEHSCAICQDSLTPEQEGRKLNSCGHWFHRGCIDTWLSGNVHCPVCRHDIRVPHRQTTPENT
jgi:hypothetical protein